MKFGFEKRASNKNQSRTFSSAVAIVAALQVMQGCAGAIDDVEGDDEIETPVEESEDSISRFPWRDWRNNKRDAGTVKTDAGTVKSDAGTAPVVTAPVVADAGTTPVVTAPVVADAGTTMPTPAPTTPVVAPSTGSADAVWSKLSVMAVTNPMDFGAAGNGTSDDQGPLNSAINALPAAGGIVFLPSGKSFRKNNVLAITKSHVKVWSVNRGAELFQSVSGQRGRQSWLFRNATGSGMFGVKLRSDGAARFGAMEDQVLVFDRSTHNEVVGIELQGSAAGGIMMSGSTEHYIEGNYIHHTFADHIHHTAAAKASWVWDNYVFNEAPTKGDDGIACVTYGATAARCNDMEWFQNKVLASGHGRGYSVIGGENINIHDNYAMNVAGAGVIIATEPAYGSGGIKNITVSNNYIYNCGQSIGHPGMLVSGLYAAAGPITNITFNNNVSVGTPGGPYRAEGSYSNVVNNNMLTNASAMPSSMPDKSSIKMADTSVLRTRDTSFVPDNVRNGLYRIHVRQGAGGGFEQRFEYVVKGSVEAVTAFANERKAAGDFVSEQRTVNGTTYALVLTKAPVQLSTGLAGVPFRDLRANDKPGALDWLWTKLNSGKY